MSSAQAERGTNGTHQAADEFATKEALFAESRKGENRSYPGKASAAMLAHGMSEVFLFARGVPPAPEEAQDMKNMQHVCMFMR